MGRLCRSSSSTMLMTTMQMKSLTGGRGGGRQMNVLVVGAGTDASSLVANNPALLLRRAEDSSCSPAHAAASVGVNSRVRVGMPLDPHPSDLRTPVCRGMEYRTILCSPLSAAASSPDDFGFPRLSPAQKWLFYLFLSVRWRDASARCAGCTAASAAC